MGDELKRSSALIFNVKSICCSIPRQRNRKGRNDNIVYGSNDHTIEITGEK